MGKKRFNKGDNSLKFTLKNGVRAEFLVVWFVRTRSDIPYSHY